MISKKIKAIILFSVLALGAFLIVFHFTDTPKVWIDEGVFTEVAKSFALHGVLGLQVDVGKFFPMNNFALSTSYPALLPVAGSIKLFGNGIWQSRLPMIVYMFILVLLFYFFEKKKYGFWVAILSVLMLISFAPFYGNGRPVLGEVPGLVYLVLGCLMLLLWEKSDYQSRRFALMSGLAFGLSAATKPIYMSVLAVALITSFLLWHKQVKLKRMLLIFGLGFLIPVSIWLFIHFPQDKSISESISLYIYLSGNHESNLSTSQTILVNLKRFYTETTPALFALLVMVTSFSFWRRFRKNKFADFSIAECVIFSFVILNWLVFLKGTGHYRYFFPAQALVYLLFPAAIYNLAEIFKNKKLFYRIVLAVPVGLIVLQFVQLIFFSQTSFTVKRTRTSELSKVLSEISPSEKIFFDASPEVIIFLKSSNYSQHLYMENLINAGNATGFNDPSLTYILSRDDFQTDYGLKCFNKKSVDRYYFFERIKNCKK